MCTLSCKFMATGRLGGYRNNGFIVRETEFAISRKESVYSGSAYYHIKDECQGFENVVVRTRDFLNTRGRIRQRDGKEMEAVIRGKFKSSSSLNDLESHDLRPSSHDREPGELSSDGSDEVLDSEIHVGNETPDNKLKNGNRMSHVDNKKRKFSTIVWDKKDREHHRNIQERITPETNTLRSQRPAINCCHTSPTYNPFLGKDEEKTTPCGGMVVTISKRSPIGLSSDLSNIPGETSSLKPNELRSNFQETWALHDNRLPTRNFTITSRWANDADSPGDECEISDQEYAQKVKVNSGPEPDEARKPRKSASPEFGEVIKEASDGTRRPSKIGKHLRSSSCHDDYDSDDCMRVNDEHNYDECSKCPSDLESENGNGSCGTPEVVHAPQRCFNMLQGCRNVCEFERLNKINEGTYGVVFRARDKKTGEIVALKKVKMEKEREGFPLTALREINVLLSCHHPFIVDVKEVVVGNNLDSIFMVMEYMEHDLKGLMETMKHPFSQSEVKCLMLQLLGGVKHLHDNWILHRDLKTSNLLLNNSGELKICDFGLARQYGSPLKPYTQLVVTLWYRAPELLLGAKQYSTAIDMWSLGCIMAELLSKEPLFNGKTEVEQLDKIFKILGTPNESIWPGFSQLPGVKVNFVNHKYNLLRRKFPATSFTASPVLSDAGFDLLNRLLTYDTDKRITAEEALNHPWFHEVPLPKSKEFMPTFPAQHEKDRHMRRVMKSPDPLEALRRKEMLQADSMSAGLFGQ